MAQPIYRVGPAYIFAGNPNIPDGAGMTTLGYTRGDVTVAPNLNISTGRVDQLGMSALAGSAWSGGIDPVVTMPLIDEDKDKLEKYVEGSKQATGPSVVQETVPVAGLSANDGTWTVTSGETAVAGTWELRAETATTMRIHEPDGTAAGTAAFTDAAGLATNSPFETDDTLTMASGAHAPTAGDVLLRIVVVKHGSFGVGSGFQKAGQLNTLALIPFDELNEGTNGIDAPNGVWLPNFVAFDFGTLTYNLPEGTDDAHVVHETQVRGLLVDFDPRPITSGGNARTGTDRILLPREHRSLFIGSPNSIAAQTVGTDTYNAPAWSLPTTTVV